ncbi:epoxide hydrolase [Mycobacterium tuberculosis]|nr:epoxide hydrolase [Mycobacterium tuberculosis]
MTRIAGPWRHLDVHANGIRFHVVEAVPSGQPEGPDAATPPMQPALARPLVILLHGFGSFWWSWRHQLCGLTGARVVAVDLRGYGGSDVYKRQGTGSRPPRWNRRWSRVTGSGSP